MATPLEDQVLQALRDAREPLTADQLLDRLPAAVKAAKPKPRPWLTNTVLERPEVGRVRRGVFVYLPDHVIGSTLRVPLVGSEAQEGRLHLGPDVAMALWSRGAERGHIPFSATAVCDLPDGTTGRLAWQPSFRFDLTQPSPCSAEFQAWLAREQLQPGDSLLITITDTLRSACRVALERLASRDPERVRARNRELADAAEAVLGEARRSLSAPLLTSWLLGRDFYQLECPPDPLLLALLLGSGRFTADRYGEIAVATKWDRITVEEEWDTIDVLAQLLGADDAREDTLADASEEQVAECPFDLRGVLPAIVAPDLSSLPVITPWLLAVGYGSPEPASSDAEVADEEIDDEPVRVYRLRVFPLHRKSLWRLIEVSDDETLAELDWTVRRAFGHDTMDHLSEFSVRTGGRRGKKGLGYISPSGGGPGADVLVGELDLETGDTMSYVYDFGDWIEHTVVVEAVQVLDPDASYPREVARNAPRYKNCTTCAARDKKERATWICIECSNRHQRDVLLCEECATPEHENHYIQEIVY